MNLQIGAPVHRALLALAITMLLGAFARTAWVSDDAFISFRVVRNFVDGFGPVWNLGERVQVFTHPLWLMALSAISLVTGEQYFSSVALSILCLAGCVCLILRIAHNSLAAATAIGALALSRVFMDYSSSGLENPLAHLLLIALFWRLHTLSSMPRWRDATLGFLFASLLVCTRLDLAVIGAPIFAALCWRSRSLGSLKLLTGVFVAGLPLFGWLLFATFYYGSPLPNTYFAKLTTGLHLSDRVPQGLAYLGESLLFDPVSGVLTGIGLVAAITVKSLRPFAFAIALHIIYVVSVGGDFMAGRFLSAPFVLALLCLLTTSAHYPNLRRPLLLASAIFLLNLPTTVFSTRTYKETAISARGIADERGFYYEATGVLRNLQKPVRQGHRFARAGLGIPPIDGGVFETCYVGMTGYYAPRSVHLVDGYGLTDPLLARLPSINPWRIGHFERLAPPGYLAVRAGKANSLANPHLNQLWEDLSLAHEAPLGAPGRLEAIWRLNTSDWKHNVGKSGYANQMSRIRKPSVWHCRGTVHQTVRTFKN